MEGKMGRKDKITMSVKELKRLVLFGNPYISQFGLL
jgi:hypothetical protein